MKTNQRLKTLVLLSGFAALLLTPVVLAEDIATAEATQGSWCYSFKNVIKYGDRGGAVAALHTALGKENLSVSGQPIQIKSLEQNNKSFGESTADTVIAFQQKYKEAILVPRGLLFGTGYVDEITQAKLNSLYSCQAASINIVSPGESRSANETKETVREALVVGKKYVIRWTLTPNVSGQTAEISLVGSKKEEKEVESSTSWRCCEQYPQASVVPKCFPSREDKSGEEKDSSGNVIKETTCNRPSSLKRKIEPDYRKTTVIAPNAVSPFEWTVSLPSGYESGEYFFQIKASGTRFSTAKTSESVAIAPAMVDTPEPNPINLTASLNNATKKLGVNYTYSWTYVAPPSSTDSTPPKKGTASAPNPNERRCELWFAGTNKTFLKKAVCKIGQCQLSDRQSFDVSSVSQNRFECSVTCYAPGNDSSKVRKSTEIQIPAWSTSASGQTSLLGRIGSIFGLGQ